MKSKRYFKSYKFLNLGIIINTSKILFYILHKYNFFTNYKKFRV